MYDVVVIGDIDEVIDGVIDDVTKGVIDGDKHDRGDDVGDYNIIKSVMTCTMKSIVVTLIMSLIEALMTSHTK